MKSKFIRLLVIFAVFSLLVTACERPASVSPTIAPTATQNEIPFPVATQPQIMADILKATQTAMALTQPAGEDFPHVTSTPAFTFTTPSANVTPEIGTPQPAVGGNSTLAPVVLATTAPTAFSYPTPTPGHPATYTIQQGEYLWCLARRFNVNIADIYSLNGMNSNSQPGIGTEIKLPSSGSFGASRARQAHPAQYTVRAGDSIGSIACWYGDADPNTIYAANGLTVGSIIVVGQVLQIP